MLYFPPPVSKWFRTQFAFSLTGTFRNQIGGPASSWRVIFPFIVPLFSRAAHEDCFAIRLKSPYFILCVPEALYQRRRAPPPCLKNYARFKGSSPGP